MRVRSTAGSRTRNPLLFQNRDWFLSASIIKVPILYAWAYLEQMGRGQPTRCG